jgi:hypothetical protein
MTTKTKKKAKPVPAPEYRVSITTWDFGKGHTEAYPDGPVKDHFLHLASQTLGLLPEITKVEFHCINHSVITVYRQEVVHADV